MPQGLRRQAAELQEEVFWEMPEGLQGQASQLQAQEIELEKTDQEREQEQVEQAIRLEAETALRLDPWRIKLRGPGGRLKGFRQIDMPPAFVFRYRMIAEACLHT